VRGRGIRYASLLLLMLLAARSAPACGIEIGLETSSGEPLAFTPGSPVRIAANMLYSLVLTIPVTSCFRLTADVRVEGRPWDNDAVMSIQPMNKLVWRADEELFALVSACIFRATEKGTYSIVVTYGDESMAAPEETTVELVAE